MTTLTKEQATVEKLLPDIRATHKAFLLSGKETVELARQIGDYLWKLKECVKHGEWQPLIEDRCEFSLRSAQTYMKLSGGWELLEKKEAAATTIDGCVKLIGQAKPKKRSAVRKAAKSGDKKGAERQNSSPPTEAAKEPDTSPEVADKSDDGPLNDEPVKELTFEEQVKEANGKIESFCRQLTKWYEENCPKLQSIDHMGRYDSALAQIKAACGTLRTCKYHDQPCPKCSGDGCSKCQKESDFGAVTVLTYRQLAG